MVFHFFKKISIKKPENEIFDKNILCALGNHCSPPCNTDDASHVRQQPERKDTGPGRQIAWRILDFFKTALRACSHSRQVEVLARRA